MYTIEIKNLLYSLNETKKGKRKKKYGVYAGTGMHRVPRKRKKEKMSVGKGKMM